MYAGEPTMPPVTVPTSSSTVSLLTPKSTTFTTSSSVSGSRWRMMLPGLRSRWTILLLVGDAQGARDVEGDARGHGLCERALAREAPAQGLALEELHDEERLARLRLAAVEDL